MINSVSYDSIVPYFNTVLNVYKVQSRENKIIIVRELQKIRPIDHFFSFVSSKIDEYKRKKMDLKVFLDLSINIFITNQGKIKIDNYHNFLNFLNKILLINSVPFSYDEFINFLSNVFAILKGNYDSNLVQKTLIKMPLEQMIIPLSVFAICNNEYLSYAFDYLLKSTESLMRTNKGYLWFYAMNNILLADEKIEIDEKMLINGLLSAFKNVLIPLKRKAKLFNSVLLYINSESSIKLIESYYFYLIDLIIPPSNNLEISTLLELSNTVLEIFQKISDCNENINNMKEKVYDKVFTFLIAFYSPVQSIQEYLLKICDKIEKNKLEMLIITMIQQNISPLCNIFLLSRFPIPEYLDILFLKNPNIDVKTQYLSVFYYLSNNLLPYKYLPQMFDFLQPIDINFLDDIFVKNPSLYCIALIQFLSNCYEIEKIECIASFLSKNSTLPIVYSRYAQKAFLIVSSVGEFFQTSPISLFFILDYLHSCIMFTYDIDKNKDSQIIHTDIQVETLQLQKDEIVEEIEHKDFNVKQSILHISSDDFCYSYAIKEWLSFDESIKRNFLEYSINQFRTGVFSFILIIAALNEDQEIIKECIKTFSVDRKLLSNFLSFSVSCSDQVVLNELKEYLSSEKEEDKAETKSFQYKQLVVRQTLTNISSFVKFSPILLEVVTLSIPANNSYTFKFTCECIKSLILRIKEPIVFNTIINKLIDLESSLDNDNFIQTITLVLKNSQQITKEIAERLCKMWFKILENEVVTDSNFEEVLFDKRMKEIANVYYLRELDNALNKDPDNYSFYSSLQRSLIIRAFQYTDINILVKYFIANCFTSNNKISEFCVDILKKMFNLSSIISNSNSDLSYTKSVDSMNNFMSELSTKFSHENSILIADSLFHLSLKKQEISIPLFIYFLVKNNPYGFVKSKLPLIQLIFDLCVDMNLKESSRIKLLYFKILDLLVSADPIIFLEEFLISKNSEFSFSYQERLSESKYLSPVIIDFLLKKVIEINDFEKNKFNLLIFKRILIFLDGFIKQYVNDYTSEEKISTIIYLLLLIISILNSLRINSIPYEKSVVLVSNIFKSLFKKTGYYLCKGTFAIKNDNQFCVTIFNIGTSLQEMPLSITRMIIEKLQNVENSIHFPLLLILLSSLIGNLSFYDDSQHLNLLSKIKEHFFYYLTTIDTKDVYLIFVFDNATKYFNVDTIKSLNKNQLVKFTQFTLNLIKNTKSNNIESCLKALLIILRTNDPYLGTKVSNIISILNTLMETKKCKLDSIIILNILAESVKKCQDISLFLKESPISFHTLIPLFLSNDENIKTRAIGIISLLIFGSYNSSNDYELLFSSVMSLYISYEKNSSQYIKMANRILTMISNSNEINESNLSLLEYLYYPMFSVYDSQCIKEIQKFNDFLKSLLLSQEIKCFNHVLSLVTKFSIVKQPSKK